MTDRMPKAIEQLQIDHRNMTRLLALLRRELDAYRGGGTLDFELLNGIMDYTLNYPDLCHHPMENLIYERMVARDPQAKPAVGDLLKEHAHLGELTRKLAAALQNISRDSEIPRSWFESIVEDYLSSNERHIAGEEKIFFPQAALVLRPEDWAAIDASASGKKTRSSAARSPRTIAPSTSASCGRPSRPRPQRVRP
jgi:hemerythrin-like domain-containing protein